MVKTDGRNYIMLQPVVPQKLWFRIRMSCAKALCLRLSSLKRDKMVFQTAKPHVSSWLITGIIFSYAAIPMKQLSRSAMMSLVSTRCSYRCRCPIHTLSLPSQFFMTNLIHGCFMLLLQSGFGYCLHCSIVGLSRKMFQSQLFLS